MRIGFIGLGQMGLPMCRNLARTHGQVTGFDSSPQLVQSLLGTTEQEPFRVANSLEALHDSDVIITMLPTGAIVRECLMSAGNSEPLASRLAENAVVVDMSSSSPLDTQALADDLARLGVSLVDAPVSGSVPKARAGTLSIMLGGTDEVAERVKPLLAAMGTAIIRTGGTGSAHAMKALNNYVYAAGLLAASEALMLGKAMDLDLGVLVDVMNASSGRNVATETKLKQHMLEDGDFKAGFALRLMAKDLRIAHGLKAHAGFSPPQLALCHDLWQQACETLDVHADNTEIYRFLESRLTPMKSA